LGSTVSIEAIRPELSEFGQYVYGLMISRSFTSFAQLCAAFDRAGDAIHRQTLSGYLKGSSSPPTNFARRLARALNLTLEEERELSWVAYKYG
jgi:transcriptional regulator with XRE-family HTH domain